MMDKVGSLIGTSPMSVGELFRQVLEILAASHMRIMETGEALFVRLAILDLIITGLFWASEGFPGMAKLIKKLLLLSGALYFFRHYPEFFALLRDSALYLGSKLSAPEGQGSFVLDPGAIMNMAFELTAPLRAYYFTLGITQIPQLLLALLLIAILDVVFLVMTLSVVLVSIEFYLFVGIGSICIPFFVFPLTRRFAIRMLEGMASFFVKLLTLACIVGIIQTLYLRISEDLGKLMLVKGGLGGGILLVLFFAMFSLFFVLRGPSLISSMLSGAVSSSQGLGGAFALGGAMGLLASARGMTARIARRRGADGTATKSGSSKKTASEQLSEDSAGSLSAAGKASASGGVGSSTGAIGAGVGSASSDTGTAKAGAKTGTKKKSAKASDSSTSSAKAASSSGGAAAGADGASPEPKKPPKKRKKRVELTPELKAIMGFMDDLAPGEEIMLTRSGAPSEATELTAITKNSDVGEAPTTTTKTTSKRKSSRAGAGLSDEMKDGMKQLHMSIRKEEL